MATVVSVVVVVVQLNGAYPHSKPTVRIPSFNAGGSVPQLANARAGMTANKAECFFIFFTSLK